MEQKFDKQIRNIVKKSNIQVPEKFHKRVENTLNMIKVEDKMNKNSISKKITQRTFLKVASLLVVGVLTVGVINSAVGENIPIIRSVFEYLSNRGVENTNYQKYAAGIGTTQSYNGVDATINEVAFDGSRLVVGYIVKAKNIPKNVEKDRIFMNDIVETTINGKKLTAGNGTINGIYTQKNTFVGIGKYELVPESFGNTPSSIDVKINIDKIGFYEGSKIYPTKGKWFFSFTVSASNAKADLKVVKPKIFIRDKLGEIKFNNVILSPFSTTIEIEAPPDPVIGWYEYTDDYRYMQPSNWTVTDDKGNVLKWESEYVLPDEKGEIKIEKGKIYPRAVKFSPASLDTKYINIKSSKFEIKVPIK
ncbi:DUF4179 domain-containing protein [Thermoanaerobacterium thermosaccharolyticum]|uniref:DUF4179 domain-containing protein n=1 Tax=Thermoanaerobacterium thermosaccharolyticum TaxID=1517 RepID=UPI003D2D88FE